MGTLLPSIFTLFVLHLAYIRGDETEASENGCSYHQYASCAEGATCFDIDLENNVWECRCEEGVEGDGLKGDNHTGCGFKKCRFDNECHTYATCNEMAECECASGYSGDGWFECLDINECADSPCHQHATCENTEASYLCVCKEQQGYKGDGFTCERTCNMDYECNANEKCVASVCICVDGYELGESHCVDVDECEKNNSCDPNAICANTVGSYTCTCKNGFRKNGEVCEVLPTNCHDIKMARPGSGSKEYEIDADGEGPLQSITVQCEMRSDIGITIIKTVRKTSRWFTTSQTTYEYGYTHSLEDIKAIISSSGFCYQDMEYTCVLGATLMDGDDFWTNGNGDEEYNWGGATMDQMCACGMLGTCADLTASCNCNGTSEKLYDNGKIINKAKLPILGVTSNPGSGRGVVKIGSVMCAPKPFDIPLSCHDAKFNYLYKVKKDGPQVLDFDGPDGELDPVLAHCDMTTYKNAGVTHIPHLSPNRTEATNETTEYPINYIIGTAELDALIQISEFCSQEAEYECTNSRLLNNGGYQGYFKDTRGEIKPYWPGGLGQVNQCACGITKTCAAEDMGCNCDLKDGVTRKDFGKVFTKEDLPIGSVIITEIGGASSGAYTIGPLMCSGVEFGIPATCQDYVYEGYTDSHTYMLDPDGPFNSARNTGLQAPFPVYCEMKGNPLYAITTIYHERREEFIIDSNGSYGFVYLWVNGEQLDTLITRSVTCSQTFKYICSDAPLVASTGESLVTWTTLDGREMTYFAGDGKSDMACSCGLTEPSTCASGGACNCFGASTGNAMTDEGLLLTKDDLPMMNITVDSIVTGDSSAYITVGPLQCKDLFPNCADMKVFDNRYRLDSEYSLKNGFYTIDPDGELGVEPFVVQCSGTTTTIQVTDPTDPTDGNPDGPVSKCYQVNYSSNGNPVSPAQVQALVDSSSFCAQELYQECQNAPLTGHSNFTTCDGETQTGWSGSRGEDKCACGVTGTCAGGPEANCNCDLEDGEMRKDGSWIVQKSRLAVCEVCVSLDSTNSLTTDPKERRVKPTVSNLYCDRNTVGQGKSCQDWRNKGTTESGPLMLDPDGAGPFEPIPVQCVLQVYPPFGWTEILPREPEKTVPEEGTDIIVEYYVYELEMIYTIIRRSRYCTQELYLYCNDSALELGGEYGWYSRNGIVQHFWAGNNDGSNGCAGGQCQCNLGGVRIDGGVVENDSLLPISRIVFGPASGTRTLKIGPVKCFDVYRDCEEIRAKRAKYNPLGNNTYAIDPDQEGEVEIFAAVCDFKTDRDIGITVIPVEQPEDRTVTNQTDPGSYVIHVQYESTTYIQIHALATISGFCLQSIRYLCYHSPLTNNPASGYYLTYDGQASTSFGVAGHPEVSGCACMATNTCPEGGHSCHCDDAGSMSKRSVDYGYETNTETMPIEQLRFGGQTNPLASARYDMTDIRCGPKPFDLPKDCQEAYERRLKTGEHLIWPSTEVEPFLVYCDMKIVKQGGVTIIGHNWETPVPVEFPSTSTVTYYNANDDQIEELTKISAYCYQPFIYTCRNTRLLSGEGYFFWSRVGDSVQQMHLGTGQPFNQECNCGRDGNCGGSENKTTLSTMNRPCNCDAADDKMRADAGVFNSTNRLPVGSLVFTAGLDQAMGQVKLGKLYCSQVDFDIDECKTGFNDCDQNAKCVNKHGTYECQCKLGWRGLGRDDVWANGRDCHDDDECAMNLCPWSAYCNNFPGTYNCTCKEGFRQIGRRKCEDIDECAEGIDACDVNARCINLAGSYDCRCNRNFRGNGFECKPLAVCACFGDPHCLSSDGHLVDYQGECQYVLSRDMCGDLTQTPTFELLSSFQQREAKTNGLATWVKEVTFNVYNYSIALMQGHEVRINGYTVNMPYRRANVNIRKFGRHIEVYTDFGVEVTWDGVEEVELYTPGQFAGVTCGICGNYNGDPNDDLEVGPGCPTLQGQLTNSSKTFGDSWVVESSIEGHPVCKPNCSEPEEPGLCEGEALIRAHMACDRIWAHHASFKECISEMDDEITAMYRYACLYDFCRVTGDIQTVICASAEGLVQTCMKDYSVDVKIFRKPGFCEITCGENMEYMMCREPVEDTCADVRSNMAPLDVSNSCMEGCYCKDGYVMDKEECVLEEECGCIYNNNYHSVGDEVAATGCGAKAVCQKGGNMSSETIQCHADAVCELKDGRYGCHCKDGYYGDGEEHCREDPCEPNPCGEDETCIRDPQEPEGYKCECSMGYIGDCGNCTEINECLTGLHDCPYNSVCINTPGSFECECHEGHIMYGGRCADLNECEEAKMTGTPVCGNNSKCSNRPGGYECPCCAGFERNGEGDCVESASGAPGPICCVCNIAKCEIPGQVCGEDGETYDSIRDMIITNCEKGVSPHGQARVDYKGKCKFSCSKVTCPMYQHCVMNEKTGLPTCECDVCTTEDIVNDKEVCSNKLVLYPSMCLFKQIMCMHDLEHVPLPDTSGCLGKGGASPVSPWGPWGACGVTCGKGEMSRSRFAYKDDVDPLAYPLTQPTECYAEPCPNGSCVNYMCNIAAAECVETDNGEPACECPACTNIGMEPVCGYVTGTKWGVKQHTWKSACHLRKFACENQVEDFEIMYPDHCVAEPLNCTRVPNEHVIHAPLDSPYTSNDVINTFECEGGCGRDKGFCCQPSETEIVPVELYKPGAESIVQEVHVIKSCDCVDVQSGTQDENPLVIN